MTEYFMAKDLAALFKQVLALGDGGHDSESKIQDQI